MEPEPDSPDRRALPLTERSLLTVQDLLASMESSLRMVQHVFGDGHRFCADSLEHYARALRAAGLVDRAEEAARRASEIRSGLATGVPEYVPSQRPRGEIGPRVLDARGAARYLALGLDTLYRLVRDGEIPHARVGKSIRFRPEDLDQYLASRTTRTWSRVDRRGRPRNGGAPG